MHDRTIGGILKVTIPCSLELGAQRSNIFIGWSKLGRQVSSIPAQNLMLRVDQLLALLGRSDNGIHGLVWLEVGSIRPQGKIMVLVISADTWEVDLNGDTCFLEVLGIA